MYLHSKNFGKQPSLFVKLLIGSDHKKAKCGDDWKIMLLFQFRWCCQNMQDLTRLEQFCPLI